MSLNFSILQKTLFGTAVSLAFVATSFAQTVETTAVNSSVSPKTKETRKELKSGYYIVVGVFGNFENLQRHNSELLQKGYPAEYGFSDLKERYYSYISYSESFDNLSKTYQDIRNDQSMSDAWILKVGDGKEEKINEAFTTEKNDETQTIEPITQPKTVEHKHHHGHKHHSRDLSVTHHTYDVMVNVHNGSYKEVPTPVRVINGESARVLGTIQSHQATQILCPKAESQRVQLICEVFGFHPTTFDINLDDPVTPSTMFNVKLQGNKILVDLPLQKYKKGDIMVMYNVFFHPNTNIMRMKSNYELQTLLQMMNENPNLRIKIHGHTNGNSTGPITKITENCDNFFNPSETEGIKGSSQKLSELRSEAIKLFLMKNGVTDERIEVKGWGGKKMIHKEDSPKYEYNVRVEIEILQD